MAEYKVTRSNKREGRAEGGMVGEFSALTEAINDISGKDFPEPNGGNDMINKASVPTIKPKPMAEGELVDVPAAEQVDVLDTLQRDLDELTNAEAGSVYDRSAKIERIKSQISAVKAERQAAADRAVREKAEADYKASLTPTPMESDAKSSLPDRGFRAKLVPNMSVESPRLEDLTLPVKPENRVAGRVMEKIDADAAVREADAAAKKVAEEKAIADKKIADDKLAAETKVKDLEAAKVAVSAGTATAAQREMVRKDEFAKPEEYSEYIKTRDDVARRFGGYGRGEFVEKEADRIAADIVRGAKGMSQGLQSAREVADEVRATDAVVQESGLPSTKSVPAAGATTGGTTAPAAGAGGGADVAVDVMGTTPAVEKAGIEGGVDLISNAMRNDIADPVKRYSEPVQKYLAELGDWKLVYDTAISAGEKPVSAARIATDELARAVVAPRLGVMLGPLAAADRLRQTPEQRAMSEARDAGYIAKAKEAGLALREAQATRALRDAQVDIELKRMQDYEVGKKVLDAEAIELRRQVMGDLATADKIFASRDAARSFSNVSTWLGLLGAGFGGGSFQDWVGQKVQRELQEQLSIVDKKRTILGDLIDQGNSMDTSYKFAEAFYKNAFAAQLEKAAGSIRDQRLYQQAMQEAQKLKFDAAKTQDAALKAQLDAYYEPFAQRAKDQSRGVQSAAEYLRLLEQAKAARDRLGLGYAELKVRKDELADKRKDRDLKTAPAAYTDAVEGRVINGGQLARVSKWNRDAAADFVPQLTFSPLIVKRADGTEEDTGKQTLTPVKSKFQYAGPTAPAVRDFDTGTLQFLDALNETEAIARRYGYSRGVLSSSDKARLEKLNGDMTSYLGGKSMRNVGVPSDKEYERLKAEVPVLTGWWDSSSPTEYTTAKFDEFRRGLLSTVRTQRNALLTGGFEGRGESTAPIYTDMPEPGTP